MLATPDCRLHSPAGLLRAGLATPAEERLSAAGVFSGGFGQGDLCGYLTGSMMTIGSDAHHARCIGSHFDQALTLMRDAGINHVALFENRQAKVVPID